MSHCALPAPPLPPWQENLLLMLLNLLPLMPLDGSHILKDTLLLWGWSVEGTAKWMVGVSLCGRVRADL